MESAQPSSGSVVCYRANNHRAVAWNPIIFLFLFLFLMVPSPLTFDVQFQRSTSIAKVRLILLTNPGILVVAPIFLNWLYLWYDKIFFSIETFVKITTSYPRYLLTGIICNTSSRFLTFRLTHAFHWDGDFHLNTYSLSLLFSFDSPTVVLFPF